MKYRRSPVFKENFEKLPKEIQEQAKKKFLLFQENPNHPSLRIKKMQGYANIWEGHVTQEYVFTFMWIEDARTGETTAVFRRIGTHDIYKNP
jgi:mRNA interferase RelE/StbE